MYYLSKLYKISKNGLIGMGGLAGIGSIVYGILLGQLPGIILVIGGSFWVIQTGIILYDNSKLLSTIRKQLVGLELEVEASHKDNKRMKDLIDLEAKNKERRVSELDILRAKLSGANDKIERLEALKEEYQRNYDNLTLTNLDLKAEVENLLCLRHTFDDEKRNFELLLSESKAQLEEVRKVKELYEIEIMNLQNTVGSQAERIEDCKEQITYLTKIYEDSREIIINMAQTSMVFDGISKSLNEGLIKIEEGDGLTLEDKKSDQVGYLSRFLSKISGLVSGMVGGRNTQTIKDREQEIDTPEVAELAQLALVENHDHISRDDLETLLNMKDPLIEK